jgi:hypothetical protein
MPNWNTHGQWQTRANACKGDFRPVVYKVRVDDEFAQWRYHLATRALWGQGVRVESFFVLCVEYVIRHHRGLKEVRRTIRQVEAEMRRKKRKRAREDRAATRAALKAWKGAKLG